MNQAANASIARVRVGGRDYPAVSEPRCRVCCSNDFRLRVENEIIAGRTWSMIAGDLPTEAELTARHIGDHYRNGHMPVQEATVVRAIEQQAEERGEPYEAVVEASAAHLDLCRAVVGRVNQRIVVGTLEPGVRDAIAAAALLAKFDPGPPDTSERDVLEAFTAYHDTARELLSPEMFREFGHRLSANPLLARLAEAWDAAHSDVSSYRQRPSE